MTPTSTIYLRDADFDSASSWALVAWCLAHGADEFTIDELMMAGEPRGFADFYEAIEPYRLPNAIRRRSSALLSEDRNRSTELWRLNDSTIAAIQSVMPDGLFTYRTGLSGWLEDLTVYRDGAIMLGIVTHEHEGFLWVTDEEAADLRKLDAIVLHKSGDWI